MRPMPRHARVAVVFGVACATLAVIVGTHGHWQTLEVLLDLAPLVALALPLILGRYLGEGLIAACRERRSAHRPRARTSRVALRPAHRVRIHGGRLIAAALAGRGPPRPDIACA